MHSFLPDSEDDYPERHQTGHNARSRRRKIDRGSDNDPSYALWSPNPVYKPVIDSDLPHLNWPERSVEVLVYSVLSFEHWLSPKGLLREWFRLNLAIAVVLMVCAVVLVPSVTIVLQGVAEWTSLSAEVAENVTTTLKALPPIMLALASLVMLFKIIQRYWQSRRYDDCR